MRILILPGGTSPFGQNKKHCDFYHDISIFLKQSQPEADVSVMSFPGQKSAEGFREGELRFNSSVQALRKAVNQSDDKDTRLVCCCWGCQIGAAVCSTGAMPISKALFWAPLPFWKLYEVCVLKDDLWAGKEELKGVKVTKEVLDDITPFEISIQRINGTRCCVAAGTQDEYVAPEVLPYFRSLVSKNQNYEFRVVEDCPHIVLKTDAAWRSFKSQVLQWILE
jgi:hypothetical protein